MSSRGGLREGPALPGRGRTAVWCADSSAGSANDATFRATAGLSPVTALIAVVAAAWTFADPGLLHGPEAMQGSARGTALVLGAMAVPMLLASLWNARRGSDSALLVLAGVLLYVVYNAVLLLFLTPFNAAFLVYVALLGSALWSLGYLAATPSLWRFAESIAQRAPVRGIAIYVWVVAGLNTAAWLAMVVPSLGPYPTPMLAGTGVQTNAIYVQDLAVWLALAAVAALWLLRREARGVVVVAAVLGLWVVEGVSVAVDQWFGVQADPSSEVVSLTLMAPFLALAAVSLVPLWRLLRTTTQASHGRHDKHVAAESGAAL
jgi:hypothetical protein